MWTDVLDLNDFYRSTLGQMTCRLLRARLREVWPNVRGESVLGLGYATPFLRPFAEEAWALAATPLARRCRSFSGTSARTRNGRGATIVMNTLFHR